MTPRGADLTPAAESRLLGRKAETEPGSGASDARCGMRYGCTSGAAVALLTTGFITRLLLLLLPKACCCWQSCCCCCWKLAAADMAAAVAAVATIDADVGGVDTGRGTMPTGARPGALRAALEGHQGQYKSSKPPPVPDARGKQWNAWWFAASCCGSDANPLSPLNGGVAWSGVFVAGDPDNLSDRGVFRISESTRKDLDMSDILSVATSVEITIEVWIVQSLCRCEFSSVSLKSLLLHSGAARAVVNSSSPASPSAVSGHKICEPSATSNNKVVQHVPFTASECHVTCRTTFVGGGCYCQDEHWDLFPCLKMMSRTLYGRTVQAAEPEGVPHCCELDSRAIRERGPSIISRSHPAPSTGLISIRALLSLRTGGCNLQQLRAQLSMSYSETSLKNKHGSPEMEAEGTLTAAKCSLTGFSGNVCFYFNLTKIIAGVWFSFYHQIYFSVKSAGVVKKDKTVEKTTVNILLAKNAQGAWSNGHAFRLHAALHSLVQLQ